MLHLWNPLKIVNLVYVAYLTAYFAYVALERL